METVLLVIHLMIAVALVATVLLQKSEGGGLGIGGSGGGGGGFLTGRGTANLLTRTTAILAACFFLTSISLTILAERGTREGSIFDASGTQPSTSAPATPGAADGAATDPAKEDTSSGGGLLDSLKKGRAPLQ